jgi:asparagine synthetase B (glutamine-hydrolysing)
MTVDSEAIFALAEAERSSPRALDKLRGSIASAWMDEREDDVVYVARGVGRPLWIGQGREELFFASTRSALELVETYLKLSLRKRELVEGTLLSVRAGHIAARRSFRPDMDFTEEPLPSVRAPEEHRSCLALLAMLVSPAAARAAAR